MRRHPLPVALLLTLVGSAALAGCNNDSSQNSGQASAKSSASSAGSVSSSSSASASASSSASGSAGPSSGSPTATPTRTSTAASKPPRLPTNRIAAASYHTAVLASNAASSPEEQAVVDAWMKYWQSVADTLFNTRPTAAFDEVSAGQAHNGVMDYLQRQQRVGRRVVGWARDNILSVDVEGDRARVHDCTKNFTFSVDEEGEPVTRPDHWYDVHGTLQQRQGSWVVVEAHSHPQRKTCLP